MTFLAILIILFFYRHWHGENPVHAKVDFAPYFGWVRSSSVPVDLRYWVAVWGPGILLFWLAGTLDGSLQGLLWLALSLVVLIYCLDLSDVEEEFLAQSAKLRAVTESDELAEVVQMQEDFQIDHLHGMFQGIVPSLFWFMILGPAGALIYVLSLEYQDGLDEESSEAALIDKLIHWMEWVPVRITGLLFCFAGNFGPTFDYWLNQLADTEDSTACHLMAMAGLAAEVPEDQEDTVVGFAKFAEAHVQEMRYLCDRALYGWLGVAALVTILNG